MSDVTSTTGSTGSGGGNMLRITGLNTGLDVDAMVKKMLTSDQTKVDQAKQQQQILEWKQDAYKSIISDIKELQSAYFDVADTSNYLLSTGNYSNMSASSLDPTSVGAKISGSATAGNYKILVTKLAQSASIKGDSINATSGSSTKLTDLGVEKGDCTLNLTYKNEDGSETTKKITLNVTESSTIKDLTNAIKDQTDGNVTAKLNELTGQFEIQAANSGSKSYLKIENGGNTGLIDALKITDGASQTGSDAVFAIKEPGSDKYIVGKNDSNNFTINGVSYNLYEVNSTNSEISEENSGKTVEIDSNTENPVTISVTQDTSKLHDLVSNFLTKYNKVVGEIRDKLSEKKDYDYSPLTDSQKEDMSDSQITAWEEKAKKGILRSDDNLQKLLDDLNNAFVTPVKDASGNSVSKYYFGSIGENALGIDGSNKVANAGEVTIVDDVKFTEAIENDPEGIMKLFTSTSTSKDTDEKFSQSGIFQRMSKILTDNVGTIGSTYNSGTLTKYANLQDDYSVNGGSGTGTLPDQIYMQQLLVTNLKSKMSSDQTKYYNQFTQLEVAMEQLNSQQSALSMYISS